MKLIETLKEKILILDGGMGTEILKRTGKSFECPEILNLEQSDIIVDIHQAYRNAGAHSEQADILY